MADLVTRIIADDKQFNDKIERSKKQTKQFSEAGNLARGALAKMAGAVGLAAGAAAAFNKVLNSTQGTGDKFNNTIGASKTTVNQFFKSLSDGDFTTFLNGLDGVYKKALKAQQILDQLWSTQNSYTRATAKTRMSITSARADAYDSELPKEERLQAVENWREAIGGLEEYAQTYRSDLEQAIKGIASTYNLLDPNDITLEDIDFAALLDARGTVRDSVKNKAAEDFQAYQDELARIAAQHSTTTFQGTNYGSVSQTILSDEGVRLQQQVSTKYKESIILNTMLQRMTDEELKDITNKLNTYDQVTQDLKNNELELSRTLPRLMSRIEKEAAEKNNISVKTEILPVGSLTELEKQITDARKTFMSATTAEGRAAADAVIKHLESQKAIVEIQFKYVGGVGDISASTPLASADPLAPLKGVGKVDMSNVIQEDDLVIFDSWSDRVQYVANQNRDAIETIYGIGDAFAGLSNIVGENAAQWMQWSANVLSAVGQGLPAIMALTTAKKAEATANTASAATGAASSVASVPFVGPILAIAAIASIVGALANLPKFALGGIVPGSSFSGDQVLARVNSGEMILNQAQQNRLLGIANGRNSGTGGQVRFVIERKQLVGMLEQDEIMNSRI